MNFTDSATLRENNCVAISSTNGVDLNDASVGADAGPQVPGGRFAPKPALSPSVIRKHAVSFLLDDKPQSDVTLPPPLQPVGPVSGTGVAQFYVLPDGKTGVLALGSFSEPSFDPFESTLLTGLQALVSKGATQLIVDVVSCSSYRYEPTACG